MEIIFKLIAYILIGALIIMAVTFAAIIVVPTLVGCIGFLLVKTRTPFVNPNGPAGIPLFYVLAWAAVITAGLLVGSLFLGGNIFGVTRAQQEVFASKVLKDAGVFFLESALILLGTLGLSGSSLARRNLYLASATSCGLASLLFTFSPLPEVGDLGALARELFEKLVGTITFPFVAAIEIAKGLASVWAAIQRWFWSTHGNLFVFGTVLSKLFFLVTIAQALRGLVSSTAAVSPRDRRPSLTGEEWQRFAWTVGLLVMIAVSVIYLRDGYDPSKEFFPVLVVIASGLFYVGLVWNLWQARPQS